MKNEHRLLRKFEEMEKEQKIAEIVESSVDKKEDNLTDFEFYSILYIKARANFILRNFEEAKKFLSQIEKWAIDHNIELFVKSKVLEANCCTITGQLVEAQKIFEEIFTKYPEIKEYPFYTNIIINYGHTFFYQGKIIDANNQYIKALTIAKERNLRQDKIKNNLALTYAQLGNYEKAIELLEEVIKEKERMNDFQGWTIAKVNLGSICSYHGDFQRANENIDIAIKFAEEKLFIRELAGAHSAKGLVLLKEKKVLKAQQHLEKAKSILEQINVKDILPEVLVRLGFIYFLLGEYERVEPIIDTIEKFAEEQKSTLFLVWGICLETMVRFEKNQDKNALRQIENVLDISLEFNIIPAFIQASVLALYIYAAIEDVEQVNEISIRALKVVEEKEIKLVQIQLYIILCFVNLILNNNKALMKYFNKLSKLNKENLYPDDIKKLNYFVENRRKTNNSDNIDNEIRNVLIDFLQRISPWF
ncbi:MAG: tetratricopeptide repeat protein [Candidatus Heimdallarchaeaceae archaeon]